MKNFFTFLIYGMLISIATGQCLDNSNIYQFDYDGHSYQLVLENRTWIAAESCATEQGGYLAEINNAAENTAIFNELNNNAGITNSNTVAPDGGGGAYVWLGGNDINTEGTWMWQNSGIQYWLGNEMGNLVGGNYNNWGTTGSTQNEPDDFGAGQDAMAISLNGWPLGSAAQWNDVADTNTLYYLIEYDTLLSVRDQEKSIQSLKIYPNPVQESFQLETDETITSIHIFDSEGKTVRKFKVSNQYDISSLLNGVYIVEIEFLSNQKITKKIIKN